MSILHCLVFFVMTCSASVPPPNSTHVDPGLPDPPASLLNNDCDVRFRSTSMIVHFIIQACAFPHVHCSLMCHMRCSPDLPSYSPIDPSVIGLAGTYRIATDASSLAVVQVPHLLCPHRRVFNNVVTAIESTGYSVRIYGILPFFSLCNVCVWHGWGRPLSRQ